MPPYIKPTLLRRGLLRWMYGLSSLMILLVLGIKFLVQVQDTKPKN